MDEASKAFDECLVDGEWWATDLLDDEDLNRILQTKSGTQLRRQLVRAVIDENRTDGFVMLLEEPTGLSIDQIKSAAKNLWDVELEIETSNTNGSGFKHSIVDDGDGWFRVWTGDTSFAIVNSAAPRYFFPATFAEEIHEPRTQSLFKQHHATLGLNVVGNVEKSDSWQMASRLLIELVKDSKPLLVESLTTGHLAVWNDSLKEEMLGNAPSNAVQSAGTLPAAPVDDDQLSEDKESM